MSVARFTPALRLFESDPAPVTARSSSRLQIGSATSLPADAMVRVATEVAELEEEWTYAHHYESDAARATT